MQWIYNTNIPERFVWIIPNNDKTRQIQRFAPFYLFRYAYMDVIELSYFSPIIGKVMILGCNYAIFLWTLLVHNYSEILQAKFLISL